MAPASVNGVATTGWPWIAISISPSDIGPSRRSGLVGVDDRHEARLARAASSRSTPRASDSSRSRRRRPPPRTQALPRLVELVANAGTCRGGGSRPASRSARGVRHPPGGRCRARRSPGRSRGSRRCCRAAGRGRCRSRRPAPRRPQNTTSPPPNVKALAGSGRGAGRSTAPCATSSSTCAGSSRTRRVARSTSHPRRPRVERPVAQDLDADLGEDPERRRWMVSTCSATGSPPGEMD